jgi:flagellar motor switch protein FliG
MSVYSRYKRDPEGLRKLVELLETTPLHQRKKMIQVGQAEDPVYTEKAISFVFTFEDVFAFSDIELTELIEICPTRVLGCALSKASKEIQNRFLKCCGPGNFAELKAWMATETTLRQVGAAQLRVVEAIRQLEKRGVVKRKRIPYGIEG